MHRTAGVLFATLTLCLSPLTSCTPASEAAPESQDTQAEDEAAIRALRDAFVEAQRAGDVQLIASFYADDAIIMPPEAASLKGIDAIQAGVAEAFNANEWNSQEPIEELQVVGDWAFTRTTWAATQTDRATGESVNLSGKAVHIYQRQPDGTWKISIDIYNFDHPAEPL
jgi:uncharacterized protein (TIGR02246 family)